MSFTVRVQQDLLKTAMSSMVRRMPQIGDALVRKVAFDVVADVAERVPVDTGRLRAGWRVSLSALANEGAESETVSVFSSGGNTSIEVTNPVEYAPFIEYGTASRPPGNHLALALEAVRLNLPTDTFGEAVADAWEEST